MLVKLNLLAFFLLQSQTTILYVIYNSGEDWPCQRCIIQTKWSSI